MKKVTYKDISKESGISIATISRCFKGNVEVGDETKKEIIKASKRLGRDVSFLEEKQKRSNLLIFNIPSLDNPFYSAIIHGARDEAESHGYDLLINEGHIRANTIQDIIMLLKRTKAAGIITANHIEKNIFQKLRSAIPVVQCCECLLDVDAPFVTIDDEKESEKATDYLLSLGKKKIAFINGPEQYKYAIERKKGYIKSLEKHRIDIDTSLMTNLGAVSFDSSVSVAFQMINSSSSPDAFLCISDVYAAAVIRACKKSGLKVPEDISVIGFDNIEFSSLFTPSITTVSQPRERIGHLCADLLRKEIEGITYSNKGIFLDTELIIRESTAVKSDE